MDLRPEQYASVNEIFAAWNAGHRNICLVMPTGSGKTRTFCHIVNHFPGEVVIIAHRNELISQTSLAIVRNRLRHRIMGNDALIRLCHKQSIEEVGHSYVDRHSRVTVASIDTLVRRELDPAWCKRVALWIVDEGHHLQRDNKWGRGIEQFPNAFGLAPTATPERADGHGLCAPDGFLDHMVIGPSMRECIIKGYLSDFRVFAPPTDDLDLTEVPKSAGGDWSPIPLRKAVHKSKKIIGNVVKHYVEGHQGKKWITFCVDVEHATEHMRAFRAAGVHAEVVTGNTPPELRMHLMKRFGRGEFSMLCAVDIVSEGTDIPNLDGVSLARPSDSYTTVMQQIGRALRPKPDCRHAVINDHVGNVARFGRVGIHPITGKPTIELDRLKPTLAPREKRARGESSGIAVRVCPACLADYPSIIGRRCPYCEHEPEPMGRSFPHQVDGVLAELSPEALAKLTGEINKINGPVFYPQGLPPAAYHAINHNHLARQQAQHALREKMMLWGGARLAEGLDIAQAQRLFYLQHGIDVGTAQTLGRPEAEALLARII
jgi:superfamily II DNA or RNA helicase